MQGTLEGDRVVMQMMFVSDPRSRALYARLTHDPGPGHAVLEGVLRPPRRRLILPFFGAFAVGLTTVAVAGLVSTAGHTLFFLGLIAFGWFAFLTMLFPRLWFPNPARAQRAMVEWLERNFEATVELGGGQPGLRH